MRPTAWPHIFFACMLFTACQCCAVAAESMLPAEESFAASIPAPDSVLGWPLGSWHARPEQITRYFEQLAAASPRATLSTIGHSHEQRPLLHLTITSAANQQRLEALRLQHLRGEGPLVIWLGYSIHGNEASGSNAAMLVAYHLLAGEAEWLDDLLANTIVIIDPMLNPDGLARFATWANMHRGQQPVGDKLHREHNEVWPGGRFNHYWFDMNRDWLPLTQPESRARVRQFQRWQPNVFGDFHEQGADAGYFFQPGVPERKHPLTPDENVRLTTALASYHAKALDAIGTRYFSRERFDDFYYGKGSTYPDVQGSVGVLYEQASARGHLVDSANGTFSFADAVRNHYATSISTLRGGHALRAELLQWQQDFFAQAARRAASLDHRGWVFADRGQSDRAAQLAEVLQAHQIDVRMLGEDLSMAGHTYIAGNSYVVPAQQRQAALIEAIFEQRSEFADNTFYDVSAWTLPLAYNLSFARLKRLPESSSMDADSASDQPAQRTVSLQQNIIGWRFPGDSLNASALAMALVNKDVPVYRVINPARKLSADSSIQRGDFVIMLLHNLEHRKVVQQINLQLRQHPVTLSALHSGLNLAGIDLGSPGIQRIQPIRPLLLTGKGINPMESGHIWHLLDRRLGLTVPMLDVSQDLPALSDYSHILLADADYSAIPVDWQQALHEWLRQGGVLITQQRSAAWASAVFLTASSELAKDQTLPELIGEKLKQLASNNDQSREQLGSQSYASHASKAAERVLGGAIFSAEADLTHPLLTGVYSAQVPVFLDQLVRLPPSRNAWSTPLRLTDEVQPMAGYASAWMREQLQRQPLLAAERIGQGSLVQFAFNPNFRAFWRGTELLYVNALLNAGLLDNTSLPYH